MTRWAGGVYIKTDRRMPLRAQIADVHAYRGNVGIAFAWLDRAYAQHDPGIAELRDDPWIQGVRSDSRYAALLENMRLTP